MRGRYHSLLVGPPAPPRRGHLARQVLQGGLQLSRGHPRPLTSPGSWLLPGKTTLPSDPTEQRDLGLTATATSLSAQPAWEWELDDGGLTSGAAAGAHASPRHRPAGSPGKPALPTCHARPFQHPQGAQPGLSPTCAEAARLWPDVAGIRLPFALSADRSCRPTAGPAGPRPAGAPMLHSSLS